MDTDDADSESNDHGGLCALYSDSIGYGGDFDADFDSNDHGGIFTLYSNSGSTLTVTTTVGHPGPTLAATSTTAIVSPAILIRILTAQEKTTKEAKAHDTGGRV